VFEQVEREHEIEFTRMVEQERARFTVRDLRACGESARRRSGELWIEVAGGEVGVASVGQEAQQVSEAATDLGDARVACLGQHCRKLRAVVGARGAVGLFVGAADAAEVVVVGRVQRVEQGGRCVGPCGLA